MGKRLDLEIYKNDLNDLKVKELKGLYKTGAGFCDGQIAFAADSLKIKGKCLTKIEADIYYDYGQRNWSSRNIVGNCYGGRLTGGFELKKPADKKATGTNGFCTPKYARAVNTMKRPKNTRPTTLY